VAAMSAVTGHTPRAIMLPDVDISMSLSTSSQAAPSTRYNLSLHAVLDDKRLVQARLTTIVITIS